MPKPIVVVGSINLDLVAATKRIPIAGETVAGVSFRTFPGGKGANQAVAVARLGGAVRLIGKLGADAFGIELKNSLIVANVDTDGVGTVPTSSGVALITTDADGQNAITIVAGANGYVSPGDLDANLDVIRDAGILLTQLEIPIETVEHLAEIASAYRIPLMLDPAPARRLPPSLLERVDWLTPNETETCILTGLTPGELDEPSLEEAARNLLVAGCRNVILKLGGKGCYLALSDGTRRFVPAYTVKAIDTTAAGDAFNGAFAVAQMRGDEPLECALWASAVAAISVTRAGAQTSMPAATEVDRFLDELRSVKAER